MNVKKLKDVWLEFFRTNRLDDHWWARKQCDNKERQADIVKIRGQGRFYRKLHYDQKIWYEYLLHLTYVTKQNKQIYKEEQVIPFQFRLVNNEVVDHQKVSLLPNSEERATISPRADSRSTSKSMERFTYDRREAVKYAEYWWNDYNPEFEMFAVDCTNYVSQCLLAGGAPMEGAPVRENGWWYRDRNWSFSWAVAHSMRWYLSGSTSGLRGLEVQKPEELYPGDVICYDFQGDGRWDHNTIVVAKDANGMPLVNAHTDNSRHRYWSYEDSTAWTPEIKYKFFRIGMT